MVLQTTRAKAGTLTLTRTVILTLILTLTHPPPARGNAQDLDVFVCGLTVQESVVVRLFLQRDTFKRKQNGERKHNRAGRTIYPM